MLVASKWQQITQTLLSRFVCVISSRMCTRVSKVYYVTFSIWIPAYSHATDIHNTLDLREERLQPLIKSLDGPSTSIHLTVANHRAGYRFQLNLEVKTCAASPSCRWKRLTKINGIYVTKDVIQAQRFVIVPKSLPSTDEYDQFGRQILAMSNGSHSGSLTQHLDEFLLAYCKYSPPSRLVCPA